MADQRLDLVKLNANALLVDDERARKYARANDIPVVGSLGIILSAKKEGLIERVTPMIESLRESDLFVSETLLEKVLRLAAEKE